METTSTITPASAKAESPSPPDKDTDGSTPHAAGTAATPYTEIAAIAARAESALSRTWQRYWAHRRISFTTSNDGAWQPLLPLGAEDNDHEQYRNLTFKVSTQLRRSTTGGFYYDARYLWLRWIVWNTELKSILGSGDVQDLGTDYTINRRDRTIIVGPAFQESLFRFPRLSLRPEQTMTLFGYCETMASSTSMGVDVLATGHFRKIEQGQV